MGILLREQRPILARQLHNHEDRMNLQLAALHLSNNELSNLAHTTDKHLREQVTLSMLQDAARLSADYPSQWKDFIRDINPTIENRSILDTFVALLDEFEEEFIPANAGSVSASEDELHRM